MSKVVRHSGPALVKVEERALPATGNRETEFSHQYKEHFFTLVRVARYKGLDRADAEDAVQDAAAGVYKRWKDGKIERLTRAYLVKAVVNQVTMFKRREGVRGSSIGTSHLEAHPGDPRVRPDVQLEHAELRYRSDEVIAGLPERCREAYLLVREWELTHAEAGDVMGISADAVNKNLCRAVAAIGAALLKAGYGPGSLAHALPPLSPALLASGTETTDSPLENNS